MTEKFDAVVGDTDTMLRTMFPTMEADEAALKVRRAMWLEQKTAEYNARALHLVTLAVHGKLSPRRPS